MAKSANGIDFSVVFPTRPSRDYAKQITLDWDKVLRNISKGDKAYAAQAARALAATQSQSKNITSAYKNASRITPTSVGKTGRLSKQNQGSTLDNSNLSAIDRDVADVRSRGIIAKGTLPQDVQALLGGRQYEEL
ncbi:MAG TPA: hypothetical protein VFK94_06315, partial [Patescibacteria group bacterium]|nr:hypothetical protein [Patescibacteria group bacterium]